MGRVISLSDEMGPMTYCDKAKFVLHVFYGSAVNSIVGHTAVPQPSVIFLSSRQTCSTRSLYAGWRHAQFV